MDSVVERLIVSVGFKVDRTSVRSVTSAYAKVAGGFALATAAAVGFTVRQAAIDDELTKTAHSLSMTTEAYTALVYAMDREGVSSQQLGGSLRYLQTQLEAAARDTGEALPWFQRFGIEATDMQGRVKRAADVLPQLSDELAKLSDGDRMSASLRTLGESGLMMGTALAKGGDNLRALLADAQQLGAVLDEETAAKAEALTDSITRMKAGATGLTRTFTSRLSPSITRLANDFTDWAVAEDGVLSVGIVRLADAMGWALDGLSTNAGKAVAGVTALGVALQLPAMLSSVPIIGGLATAFGAVSAPVWGTVAAVGAAALIVDDLIVAANGGDSAIMHLAESMGYGAETSDLLADGLERASALTDMLGASSEASSSILWEATKPWRKFGDAVGYVIDMESKYFTRVNATADFLSAIATAAGFAVEKLTDFESAARGFAKFTGFVEKKGLPASLGYAGASVAGQIGRAGYNAQFDGMDALIGRYERQLPRGYAGSGPEKRWPVLNVGQSSADPYAQSLNITPNVSITTGVSASEAASAAAREVESQVYSAFATSAI